MKRKKDDDNNKKNNIVPIQPKKPKTVIKPCYVILVPGIVGVNDHTNGLRDNIGSNNNINLINDNNVVDINKSNNNTNKMIRKNIMKKKNVLNTKRVNFKNKTHNFSKSSSPSSLVISSSSSSSSPLYKAVEIQTVGVSRTKKKSQGSQVGGV